MAIKPLISPLAAAVISGAAFLAVSGVQDVLPAQVDVGVSAPYLPAGVRLVAVVVFGLSGAVGLSLASLWVAQAMFPAASGAAQLAIAIISGFTPMLALAVVRRGFGIGEQLRELSFRSLLLLIVLMSLLSPIAHQLVFMLTGAAPASVQNLIAMIAGDVVGAMLVVLLVATVWSFIDPRPPR